MRKHRIEYILLYYCIIFFSGLLIVIGGCANPKKQMVSQIPLSLGVVYDVSGSVNPNGVPVMQSSHLVRMLSILKKRGGVMAFGLIDEKSYKPLDRLSLVPVTGRLDKRAQYNTRNQSAISQFQTAVESKIGLRREAKKTDFNGAMRRFALFFDESTGNNAEKVFIIISDGIETGPERQQPSVLPDGVKVFAVGMEKDMAMRLFGDNAAVFESIDAAIDALQDGKGGLNHANNVSRSVVTR